MKLIKQATAGLLLTLGIFLLVCSARAPFRENNVFPDTRGDEAINFLLLGLPITGAGGWLVWTLHQKDRKQLQQRLQSLFFQLLHQNQGKITLMQFASEAQLTADVAKQYLDKKALEFSATFNVSEDGHIYYCFYSIGQERLENKFFKSE